MRHVRFLAFLSCLMLCAMASARAEFIKLRNGQCVEGQIVGCDANGFTFVRRDSREPRYWSWTAIDAQFAEELKRSYLPAVEDAGADGAAEQVPAVELRLKNGSVILGVLEEEGAQSYILQRRGMIFSLPRAEVASITTLFVDPGDVYRDEDLLQKRREEFHPRSPADYRAFGDYCKDLEAYAEAREAYRMAIALDESLASELRSRLELMEALAQNEAIERAYGGIRRAAFDAHDYDQAEALLRAFEAEYPERRELAVKIRDDIENDKDRWLLARMARAYFDKLHRECFYIAARRLTYAESVAAVGKLKADVETHVQRKLDIDAGTFQEIWSRRNQDGNYVAPRFASWGNGTHLEAGNRSAPVQAEPRPQSPAPRPQAVPSGTGKDSSYNSNSGASPMTTAMFYYAGG